MITNTSNAEKRVKKLEDINKKLQRVIDVLMRRLSAVERKGNNTAHTARVTEHKVSQLQRTVQLNETKVSRVEDILRNH